MLKKDIIITLDDNQEYGITEVEIINGIEYALMININNKKSEFRVCKVIKENDLTAVVDIESEDLNNVIPVFYSKAKNYLDQFMFSKKFKKIKYANKILRVFP